MSLQLDDDLHEILKHLVDSQTGLAWVMQTIVKLVLANQQLRKTLQVAQALEPRQYASYAVPANATFHTERDAMVNPLANNLRELLDNKDKQQLPEMELDTIIRKKDVL